MAEPSPPRSGNRRLSALAGLARIATGRGVRIQGFVDAIVRGDTIVGWARDRRDPERRLEIQLLDRQDVVGFGIADLPRKDLLAAGMGDGKYGFRLKLSPQLLDGQPRALRVCAVTDRGKIPLERGALNIASQGAIEAAPAVDTKAGSMVGALERLVARQLHGWAFNPDQPTAPALVDVYDDERYLGSVMADRSRPRLYEKGFPSGARGFIFELPKGLEPGVGDRVRARVAGTMYDLRRAREFTAPPVEEAPIRPPVERAPEPARAPVVAEASRGAPAPPRGRSKPIPSRAGAPVIALWIVGGGAAEAIGTSIESWETQEHDAIRLMAGDGLPELPQRLRGALIRDTGKASLEALGREALFVLFAHAGERLDPALAATIAVLPRFPDLVFIGVDRPLLSAEAARLDVLLDPERGDALAVRTDVLLAYPGDLPREIAGGLLSPLRLWLAQRGGLRALRIVAPTPKSAAIAAEPEGERRARGWSRALDAKAWEIGASTLTPRLTPGRMSIGLWRSWDDPDLPALRALLGLAPVAPLDILVPGEGDERRAFGRLEAAEAAIAAASIAGARARVIDCAPGERAICAALLAAADGDVALLSSGGVVPDAADLPRMAAWSLHPHAGPVGLSLPSGWSSGVVLDDAIHAGSHVPGGGGGQVVDAIAWSFIMVAPEKIAAAGAPDLARFDLEDGALEFGLRMARHGFHPLVLAGGAGGTDATAEARLPMQPLPWHTRAMLHADGLLSC